MKRKLGRGEGSDSFPHGQIEVVLDHGFQVPTCPHGPTLMFERFKENGERILFFACAVCRDRKLCSFYQALDEKRKRTQPRQESSSQGNHLESFHRFKAVKALDVSKRSFCNSCSTFIERTERAEHKDHAVINGITDHQLMRPSKLLTSRTEKGKESQYWFSEAALLVLKNAWLNLKYDSVLCIGAPTVFESLGKHKKRLRRFLLDVDERYENFVSPKEFGRYSMFAHHFYDERGQRAFHKFLSASQKLLVIVDPPFGGLVAPLAQTTKGILAEASEETTSVIWVLPYFMESKVSEHYPQLAMMDYKVGYDNHPLFQGKKSKTGSPIRFFTNIPAIDFVLPKTEGYRLCEKCQKYVSEENRHCDKCNSCTSKDGKTYSHCGKCDGCVKPSYIHCKGCGMCHLPHGNCRQKPRCHFCGQEDHKRTACPQRNSSDTKIPAI